MEMPDEMPSDNSHVKERNRAPSIHDLRMANPWTLFFHWEPKSCHDLRPDAETLKEDYDGSFLTFRALAPAVWLAIVGACLLASLCAVGYLTADAVSKTGDDPLQKFIDALPATNAARHRAAMAFSGVTLAITVALSIASAVWAVAAFRGKENLYRNVVLAWIFGFFLSAIGVLVCMHAFGFEPYASTLANRMLNRHSSAEGIGVPDFMFGLACFVPVLLAAGACFLLQPVRETDAVEQAKVQLRMLAGRLRELDQLLYVGALALVFGTLQLSSGLAIPLASLQNSADLKVQVDLCKSISPMAPASSPFFTPGVSTARPKYYDGFDVDRCRKLPQEIAQLEVADDLRQLARGITLSFGLAFSALLAAIYVPALIVLGLLIAPAQKVVDKEAMKQPANDGESTAGDVDPLRRTAAIIATLSPLIAGLLANAFASS